jgi:hypothetical protein
MGLVKKGPPIRADRARTMPISKAGPGTHLDSGHVFGSATGHNFTDTRFPNAFLDVHVADQHGNVTTQHARQIASLREVADAHDAQVIHDAGWSKNAEGDWQDREGNIYDFGENGSPIV